MSVIKGLQDYISKFKGLEILTERTEEYADCYAIYPSGNGKVSEDILGNKTYKNSYILLAKRSASEEFERQESYNFLEEFCDWVENNSDKEIFPQLGNKMRVQSLDVSNIMMMIADDGFITGTYQIQINLIYIKEI